MAPKNLSTKTVAEEGVKMFSACWNYYSDTKITPTQVELLTQAAVSIMETGEEFNPNEDYIGIVRESIKRNVDWDISPEEALLPNHSK